MLAAREEQNIAMTKVSLHHCCSFIVRTTLISTCHNVLLCWICTERATTKLRGASLDIITFFFYDEKSVAWNDKGATLSIVNYQLEHNRATVVRQVKRAFSCRLRQGRQPLDSQTWHRKQCKLSPGESFHGRCTTQGLPSDGFLLESGKTCYSN